MAAIAQHIRDLSDRQTTTLVVGLLLGFFFGAVTVSLAAYGQGSPANLWQWVDGFAQNFGTEMFGAFLTFLLFDRLVGERQRKREVEERYKQDQLNVLARLKQADSPEERLAILDEMNARKLLKGANLRRADLSKANLIGADLTRADLFHADLNGADLIAANLIAAYLRRADLRRADLGRANLEGTFLHKANLERVRKITIEQLTQAESLQGATLPDGTKLPDNDSWQEVFKEWCKTVPVDENGYIIVPGKDDQPTD